MIWCRPFRLASPPSWKTPVTFIDSICLNNHPEISKESRQKSTPSKWYQTGVAYIHRTQSLKRYISHRVLREVMRRSTCWKKEAIPAKKTNRRACTNIWLLAGHKKGRLGTRFQERNWAFADSLLVSFLNRLPTKLHKLITVPGSICESLELPK